MKASIPVIVVVALSACEGGSGGDDADEPDASAPDAPVGSPDAASEVTCLASASYGDATLTNQRAHGNVSDPFIEPSYIDVFADLTAPLAVDFTLELWQGAGAFATGEIRPGTYPLTGDELVYGACGLCLRLYSNSLEYPSGEDAYMATGGTITITTVRPRLSGSVSNATFRHGLSGPLDGCTSAITSASFDAAYVPFP